VVRLAVVVLPTLLAAVLVLWGLGRASLWSDEVASVSIRDRSAGSLWHVIVHHEANMALFDLILHPWQWLGQGEAWLRVPSTLCAIATVAVTALLGRRLAGAMAAAVAGTVVALNGFLVVYGQQVRGYALVMLLSTAVALLLVRALDLRRRRDWVLWALCAGALPYPHILGVLVRPRAGRIAGLLPGAATGGPAAGRWAGRHRRAVAAAGGLRGDGRQGPHGLGRAGRPGAHARDRADDRRQRRDARCPGGCGRRGGGRAGGSRAACGPRR
jgi:mannosyltransferase